jgi:hypothetical protein
MARKKADRIGEQVVVYLAPQDRALLEQMADKTGLARTELFRRGLRRLADEMLGSKKPGSSFEYLIANSGADDGLPPDVAARHDYYLAAGYEALRRKPAKGIKRKTKRARTD